MSSCPWLTLPAFTVIGKNMSSTMYCLSVGALLLLICSGCTVPAFEHPLIDPSDAKAFPSLYGVYRSTDCPNNMVHYVHLGPAGKAYPAGLLRIISVAQPTDAERGLDSKSYLGFVEQIGDHHVLHIPVPGNAASERKRAVWDQKWDPEQLFGYALVRLTVRPDAIEMSSLNNDFLEEQIAANTLAGEVAREKTERDGTTEVGEKTITVTADSERLRKFFARHIDGPLFNDPDWEFTRAQ